MMKAMIREITPKEATDKEIAIKKNELKKACRDFESLFVAYLLKTMKASIPKAEEPSQAKEIYEAMLDEAIAREISLSKGLGLGDLLYEQLEPLITKKKK